MRSRDAIGMPLIDRFLGRVSMLPDASGCWLWKKGRWKPLRSRAGANGSNAKLTEEDVREIRRLRREKVPLKVVSSRFGIGVAHVVSICKYKVWTYVA
jgi:hypothetical protein